MKKRHVYKRIELWEGSSEHWRALNNLIEDILSNYDEIANKRDGLYLHYDFFKTLTEKERKQLYLIGEQWLITIHVIGFNGIIEGPDFACTLNEKGMLDR